MTSATQQGNTDLRAEAFCRADGDEIFRPVACPTDVWSEDPFDVESIHRAARDTYQQLLDRATADDGAKAGKVLLLKGESGSGKTHLMRAFRTATHRQGIGYFGYMQMTSSTGNYGRYILHKLIDSLDKPYIQSISVPGKETGLERLSNSIADLLTARKQEVAELRDEATSPERFAELAEKLADDAVAEPTLANVDLDLVRALLCMQTSIPGVRSRVIKYLRGEGLSANDRARLAGVVPVDSDENALEMICRLGRLMWAAQGAAMVLCVDQLEDIFNYDQAADKFRRAIEGLLGVVAHVPSAIVVVSCLEDYYDALVKHLDQSARDRIEQDPKPIRLESGRSLEEIRQIVSRHLESLYESFNVAFRESEPTYPIADSQLASLVNLRTRSVLQWCKDYHDESIRLGSLAADVGPPKDKTQAAHGRDGNGDGVIEDIDFDEEWSDHLAEHSTQPPDEEGELAEILAEAIEHVHVDLISGHTFATEVNLSSIRVARQSQGQGDGGVLVGICNQCSQGGHLGKQLDTLLAAEHVGPSGPIVVRSVEYQPKGKNSAIAQKYYAVLQRGGRFVVVADGDWRALQAFPKFDDRYNRRRGYSEWRKKAQPLAHLQPLREILGLDALKSSPPDVKVTPPVKKSQEKKGAGTQNKNIAPPKLVGALGPVVLGRTNDRAGQEVSIQLIDWARHAAFLGSTGSGKTTVALNVVEQLLLRGVPALLVDRKGDLAAYANPGIWNAPAAEPALAERQAWLKERVDVALFTPGRADGRSITLNVVPAGMCDMKSADRQITAQQAANSLASMLNYKATGATAPRIAVLQKAIELLGSQEDQVTLQSLTAYIQEQDTELVNGIGALNPKLFEKVLQDLETIKITKQSLFPEDGAPLDADLLFGRGAYEKPGKTRLSVISTKFLGDLASLQFWVAQLVLELSRWASKSPKKDLQAVVLFDEADIYLPATSKPATKEPMEGLLKRARSAGLGVFLASQSPGDLDYKSRENINTWFLGKIKEPTAIAKMKPMLSEFKKDVSSSLANQTIGQFFLAQSGQVTPVACHQGVVKTEQVPEHQILEFAARGRAREHDLGTSSLR